MAGFIVPTGIATDDNNKEFFGAVIEANRMVSLFDFENREAIFPGVHRSYKFCLLTIGGSEIGISKALFGFFMTRVENLQDKLRVFSLSADDFLRLNPNTKTCPVFRTSIDAELTNRIYRRVPILINDNAGENPWGISFQTIFHMSNDSHLFKTREQLESQDYSLWGNKMKKESEIYLPLYEAKMIWHFDHRFGTYEGILKHSQSGRELNRLSVNDYNNKDFNVLPHYWISEDEFKKCKLNVKFAFVFRDITNATSERTSISTILPINPIGHNMPLMFNNNPPILVAQFNNIIFDYFTRQKVNGDHFTYIYVKQFPVISPEFYPISYQMEIVKKVMELIYTSWDIKSFADSVWNEYDDEFKGIIQKQWESNKEITGGNKWDPPEWCEIDKDGCPLPPFKWDEDRRAVLKAELDAIYAKLYGLTTDELRYILDPQDVYGPDFPGETFRVLKEKEIRNYGEYRTKRLVLDAWEKLQESELLKN